MIRFAQEHSPPVAQLAVQSIIAETSNILVDFISHSRLFRFGLEVIPLDFGASAPLCHAYGGKDHDDKEKDGSTDNGDRRHLTAGSFFAAPMLKPRRLIAFRI